MTSMDCSVTCGESGVDASFSSYVDLDEPPLCDSHTGRLKPHRVVTDRQLRGHVDSAAIRDRRRCAAVPSFNTVTETRGMTAELASVTRPTMLPLNDCPHKVKAARKGATREIAENKDVRNIC